MSFQATNITVGTSETEVSCIKIFQQLTQCDKLDALIIIYS